MGKSLSSIIDELKEVVEDLEHIDDFGDIPHADDSEVLGVIECLVHGLPHIIEKYGHSSNEAEAVRLLIQKWT